MTTPVNRDELDQALTALHGTFADGYTSEDADDALGALSTATGLDFVIVWEFEDCWGTGGNSDVFARDSGGLRHVSGALWEHLNGDGGPDALADRIDRHGLDALLGGPATPEDLYGAAAADLHQVSAYNLAAAVHDGEAPGH